MTSLLIESGRTALVSGVMSRLTSAVNSAHSQRPAEWHKRSFNGFRLASGLAKREAEQVCGFSDARMPSRARCPGQKIRAPARGASNLLAITTTEHF
jgi:hypothetical protein